MLLRPMCASFVGTPHLFRSTAKTYLPAFPLCLRSRAICSACNANPPEPGYLEREIERARREKRPYNIDKSKLTPVERQQLRLRSRAIPLLADSEPLDIVYEDDTFLAVCKPSFIKMHPSHRFEGGSLLNRAIGYLGYQPWLLHRLDMVSFSFLVTFYAISRRAYFLVLIQASPETFMRASIH